MRELRKQDRTSSRLPTDTERKYKLGQIELTAEEVEQLKSKLVVDEYLSATSSNAIANKTVTKALNNKVSKEEGKGLSTNDFTNDYKNKSHTHANKSVIDSITQEDINNWNSGTGGGSGGGSSTELIGTNGTPSDTNTYHANAIKELMKETYSSTEQVIGTWINGKPIYRIVLDAGALSGTTMKTVPTPRNIDTLIRHEGMLYDSSGHGYPLNYNNIWNLNQDIGTFYFKGQGIQIKAYTNFDIVKGHIIIEYTKTTD